MAGGLNCAERKDDRVLDLNRIDNLDHLIVPKGVEIGLWRIGVLKPAPGEIGAHASQLGAYRVVRADEAKVFQQGCGVGTVLGL